MKNRIIAIFLSLIICITVILQPKTVKANPVVFVGGGLFVLLMTALAHAGYTVENQDSANYIYDFFFKKWLSDEDLEEIKELDLESQANAKEFWDGIAEKLTTPLDSKYPSLKGVFDYKVTSAGAKIVANCTPALKQAIDQLVQDLPSETIKDLGSLSSVPVQSLPFTLNNCYFPSVPKAESFSSPFLTSDFIKIKVKPVDISSGSTVYVKFDTAFNEDKYATSLGKILSANVPAGVTEFSFYLQNRAYGWDDITFSFYDDSTKTTYDYIRANIVRPDNPSYDRKYSFTIDSVKNCTIESLEICDSLWEIPFNEGSKALYRDNEAIWEQMGSIEAKLDDVISQPLTDSYPQSIGMTFPLTQEVADTYVQEKDEIDIKSKDEVKEEETQTPVVPEVPIDSITDNSSKLTDKFPFCIPFDLVRSVQSFKDNTNTKIEFDVPIPYSNDPLHFCLDFEQFEVVVIIFRFFSLLMFIISMLILTRNIIRG